MRHVLALFLDEIVEGCLLVVRVHLHVSNVVSLASGALLHRLDLSAERSSLSRVALSSFWQEWPQARNVVGTVVLRILAHIVDEPEEGKEAGY